MKQFILFSYIVLYSTASWAQVSRVQATKSYLDKNNYRQAQAEINQAIKHAETKNNALTWHMRGLAYLQQSMDTNARTSASTTEAYKSLKKALELKPDYGKEIDQAIFTTALISFNEGVVAYNNPDGEAYEKFMTVLNLYKIGNGSRFRNNVAFKEMAASARSNAAYAAVKARRYNEALGLFNEMKTASKNKDSSVYYSIIEIYLGQKNYPKLLSTIKEARANFPQSEYFRNQEINYYITTGASNDVLMRKLEDAAAAEPNNPELLFNLANSYERVSFPKDASREPLPLPANFESLFSKAEKAYLGAVTMQPDNYDYNYNLGVLYYERAGDLNRQMIAIPATDEIREKKFDSLQLERDRYFTKALPYFEKIYTGLSARPSLMVNEKITFRNVLVALNEIYTRLNNKAKADEVKAKLDGLK